MTILLPPKPAITTGETYTVAASSEDEPLSFGCLINHSPLVAHTNVKPQFKKWESSEGTKRCSGNVKSFKSILFHAILSLVKNCCGIMENITMILTGTTNAPARCENAELWASN